MPTHYQRAEIVRLLQKLEFDDKRLTLMHRRLGAPETLIEDGMSVDIWLDGVTQEEASALIDKMRGML